MFTGQIIGYVGADARQNKNGKGFNFHVSTKYKNTNNEEQTLWVCCFVNYECKVSEYLKKAHRSMYAVTYMPTCFKKTMAAMSHPSA